MRLRSGIVVWLVVIVAIAALLLVWQYLGYRSANRTLPAGMTMAGLSVEGMMREEALNALETAFATPLEVVYLEQRLALPPDSIELRYSVEETAANLDEALAGRRGFDGLVAYVLRRPFDSVDVPVAVGYSEERLNGFLARVVRQYDRPPQEPVPLLASLTFRPGQPGYELDVEASRARLAAALIFATEQEVELVVRMEEAPPLEIEVLDQMLRDTLDDHPGLIGGIFIKNLHTGDELGINADVAYTGLGVLKIAVAEEAYRILDSPLDPEITDWLSDTLSASSSNSKTNLLLNDVIGNGDSYQGAENLTDSMSYLGLRNTFMAAPYDEEEVPLAIVTPANSRADITAEPDPSMQTTPLDVGLLLEMIYQCSHDSGALMVAYPGALAADECNQMIEWMSANRIDSFIEAGVPMGTQIARKHGWIGDTHADAALVFSPGGDFVLVVFLYRSEWLEWEESAPLIADIATATYNYFNPAQ